MRHILYTCLLALTLYSCRNPGNLKLISSLPISLHEISGLEKIPQSPLLWAVADSNNAASLYGFNPTSQQIEKTINLYGIENNDWEDIAADPEGNLYIGDFGNNNNKRRHLAIYKIPKDMLAGRSHTVYTTTFSYEDQIDFPPKKRLRNFDVESFIYYQKHFYLFTRNRSSPFDGTVKLYKIPATPGHHIAKWIGSFKSCANTSECQITSATIDFKTNRIVLLSYSKVWILSEYQKDAFFEGKITKIDLDHHSQKESVCFKNTNSLYIADEQQGILGGNIYEFSLNR